jgi:hypothetical protein
MLHNFSNYCDVFLYSPTRKKNSCERKQRSYSLSMGQQLNTGPGDTIIIHLLISHKDT